MLGDRKIGVKYKSINTAHLYYNLQLRVSLLVVQHRLPHLVFSPSSAEHVAYILTLESPDGQRGQS